MLATNVGILPWKYMKERGDEERSENVGEVRRNAFATLFDVLDEVANRLGAKLAYFPVATIPEEKMLKYGCIRLSGNSFWQHLARALSTFPARNIRAYVKLYRTD